MSFEIFSSVIQPEPKVYWNQLSSLFALNNPDVQEIAWRCLDPMYQGGAIYGQAFRIIKRTPKGFWIATNYPEQKRFVLADTSGKRYAYEDPKKALEAYWYRKRRQVRILEYKLEDSRTFLEQAKEALDNFTPPDTLRTLPKTT